MVDYEAPENTPPPKRFPSFSYKRAGLVFGIIVVLFIANGRVFKWAKQVGISTFSNRNLPKSVFEIAFDSNDTFWVGGEEFTPYPVDETRYFATMMRSNSTKTYEIEVRETGSPETGQPWFGQVTSITVDSDGQVWIGGGFGLRRLTQQGKWVSEWDSDSLEDYVYALAADQQGQIWVSTRNYLSKYVDSTRTDFPAEIAKDLDVDQQGRVWLLDRDDNISYLAPDGNWEHSALPIQALSFAIDADGRVWARIGYGIAVCNPDTQKCSVYRSYNSGIDAPVVSTVMAFDNENRLWIPYSRMWNNLGGRFIVIDVDEILPVGLLNGLWTSRIVLDIVFALGVYFFIVRFFDSRKIDTLPESMTWRYILRKNRLTLILFGVVGPVLALLPIGSLPQVDIFVPNYMAIIFVGILGAAIMLTRLYSYRTVGIHIPKKDASQSVISGALISTACMFLSFYTLFRFLLMFLISE